MKYSKHIFLLLISIICVHSFLSAQAISKISNKKFHYQGQTFKYQDMAHIFSQNEEANDYYIKANKNLKTGKILRTISLSSLGIGIIAAAAGGKSDGFCIGPCNTGQAIGGFTILLVTIPAGITAITFGAVGRKKRKKSIELFNRDYGFKLPKENPIDVQLVMSNGLGVQLQF